MDLTVQDRYNRGTRLMSTLMGQKRVKSLKLAGNKFILLPDHIQCAIHCCQTNVHLELREILLQRLIRNFGLPVITTLRNSHTGRQQPQSSMICHITYEQAFRTFMALLKNLALNYQQVLRRLCFHQIIWDFSVNILLFSNGSINMLVGQDRSMTNILCQSNYIVGQCEIYFCAAMNQSTCWLNETTMG